MEELPLVELFGDVVLDMVRNADGTADDFLQHKTYNYMRSDTDTTKRKDHNLYLTPSSGKKSILYTRLYYFTLPVYP